MTHLRSRSRTRRVTRFVAPVVLAAVVLAACGSGTKSTTTTATTATTAAGTQPAGELTSLTIGYSAWPGWFPLAVADKAGIFTKAGLKVDLKYFVDYTASLDALVAGQLDVNAQTLNDTIFAVASGSDQKIVVTGDNSTGNDAVICDQSITTIDGLKGKTIAAEAGVVDHFLLLQGLATKGMTEKDISFQGVKTDAAAAAFAGGQFDCAAVFAPFTLQALERPGSHVLFSSKDFPGTIPDHLVATAKAAADPVSMQKLVNAWYMTLDYIKANPDESTKIMADVAGLSVADYQSLADGTTLFTADQALSAFADRPNDPTSLVEMARRINPFLVSSGLTKTEADLSGIFDDTYTKAYVDGSSTTG
ncbi:MAG: aliphatic sulfonates family transporter, periplasmic ligand-binding protein [Ilumatobacteraceae bacterium]|nr:aliphatic sulfonates family transporter, periplasmic ligand-binding protein [Ilumatobacteraceae bacterium]